MASAPSPSALRPHACVLCQRRKVKCDRSLPCSGCTKARTQCEYRDPLPPRRRKKKLPEVEMAARLKRYEEILRKSGIDSGMLGDEDSRGEVASAREATSDGSEKYSSPQGIGTPVPAPSAPSKNTARSGPGRLITREGRSLYLDKFVTFSCCDCFKY
jgi:hypothetical protein